MSGVSCGAGRSLRRRCVLCRDSREFIFHMSYLIKVAIPVSVLSLQFIIVFFIDDALARALVGKYAGAQVGTMFQFGVDSFMEAKENYNIASLASTFLLVIIILWPTERRT